MARCHHVAAGDVSARCVAAGRMPRKFGLPSGLFLLPWLLASFASLAGASWSTEEPELAVEQVKQEALLEAKYAMVKSEYGVNDTRTLEVFFELFDVWIKLYRLTKADDALREIVPACERRQDDFTIKAVQALAFTRWKQGRHLEALSLFHEMEVSMGKTAALSENIGHTYNAIGAHDDAERSFKEALALSARVGGETNLGGILLGLASVLDRQDKPAESFAFAQGAYDWFRAEDKDRGWDTSLSAKAGMQLSNCHMKLGSLQKAEGLAREAVRLFEVTAGDDSPLVAGALERLGQILWRQARAKEAQVAFHRSYQLEGIKDAFDLLSILDIHKQLVETHLPSGLRDRAAFKKYFNVVGDVVQRVRHELPQDGNAGAYYKAAGELYILGQNCETGSKVLQTAIGLLVAETAIDTSGLVKQCTDLVSFCSGTSSKASS